VFKIIGKLWNKILVELPLIFGTLFVISLIAGFYYDTPAPLQVFLILGLPLFIILFIVYVITKNIKTNRAVKIFIKDYFGIEPIQNKNYVFVNDSYFIVQNKEKTLFLISMQRNIKNNLEVNFKVLGEIDYLSFDDETHVKVKDRFNGVGAPRSIDSKTVTSYYVFITLKDSKTRLKLNTTGYFQDVMVNNFLY